MLKVLDEACTPTKGSKFSACIDLRASEDVVIGAGETKMVGLGVCINIDFNTIHHDYNSFTSTDKIDFAEWFMKSHYLQLMLRSSLGKKGLIAPHGVGIIDMDYRDEIRMLIHNPINKEEHQTLLQQDKKFYDGMCAGWNNALSENGEHPQKYYERLMQLKDSVPDSGYVIKKGDKIAQITLLAHKAYMFGISTEVERDGGFGSTDKQGEKND